MQRAIVRSWWFLGVWAGTLIVIACVVFGHVSRNMLLEHFLGELADASANKALSADEKHAAHVAVFEKYWPQIPSAAIIGALSRLPRSCHVLGHTVGKMLARTAADVSEAIALCRDSCQGGCFHGVLMGLFGEEDRANALAPSAQNEAWLKNMRGPKGHIAVEKVAIEAPAMCHTLFQSGRWAEEEECAHGMGHVYMMAKGNDVQASLRLCQAFPAGVFQYYCAGGVYMEREDKTTVPARPAEYFRHCEVHQHYAEAVPACYRYTVRWVLAAQGLSYRNDVVKYCHTLTGLQRRGCFHGYGFSSGTMVAKDPSVLPHICGFGSDQDKQLCFDGALAGVLIADAARQTKQAEKACQAVATGPLRNHCLQTIRDGFYGGKHDYALYAADL